MATLTLTNFKCHDNLKININNGHITLLNGHSGIGKSTILQAITWCLYGNVRNVHNRNKDKLFVILEIVDLDNKTGKLVIYRQKKPGLLRVSITPRGSSESPISYEDAVAQDIINSYFGELSLWEATSYIPQGYHNALLSRSNVEKMEVLNKLAFHSEDPDVYINKIEENITATQTQYAMKQEQLSKVNTDFNQLLYLNNISRDNVDAWLSSKSLSQITLSSMKAERDSLAFLLSELNIKLLEQSRLRGFKLGLESTLKSNREKLESLPEVSSEDINKHNITINDLNRDLRLLTELQQCDISIAKYRDQLSMINIEGSYSFTQSDLLQAEIAFNDYERNKSICDFYHLPYNKESVEKEISYQENLIKIINNRKIVNSLNLLQERIDKLTNAKQISSDEITSLQNSISNAERGRDVLECPQCKVKVRWSYTNTQNKGSLILSPDQPSSEQEIAIMKNKLASLLLCQREFNERCELITQKDYIVYHNPIDWELVKGSNPLNNGESVEQCKNKISSLSKIQFVDKPDASRTPNFIRNVIMK